MAWCIKAFAHLLGRGMNALKWKHPNIKESGRTVQMAPRNIHIDAQSAFWKKKLKHAAR